MRGFEPSQLKTFELRNDYQTIHVQERLEDTKDPDNFEFHQGQVLTYEVDYDDDANTHIRKDGYVIQQLDLNDGGSADDLNMPRSGRDFNESNTLVYVSSSGVTGPKQYELADFTTGIIGNADDFDGIDQGPWAELKTEVSRDGTGLIVTIKMGGIIP